MATAADLLMTEPVQQKRNKTMFGKVLNVSMQDVALIKGQGKQPFNPAIHSPQQRTAQITIQMVIYNRDQETYNREISDVHFGSKWAVVRESIKALGIVSPSALDGMYFCAKSVGTGRKYMGKKYDSNGADTGEKEEREEESISFLAFFKDEAECLAAREKWIAETFGTASASADTSDDSTAASASASATDDTRRMALIALYQASGSNPDVFKTLIAANPTLINGITIDRAIEIAQGK